MAATTGSGALHRKQSSTNLAWLDLEMTGLDPERDVILQAALIITNAELEPLEEFSCDVWQPPRALEGMTPFVRAMHEKTGLLSRVAASTHDLARVEKLLLERVSGWCTYPAMLCGNSIGQDKRFVERWMPGLAGYLSYRSVDVSSLKVLARLWHGEAGVYPKPTTHEHDALFDIRQSIAELAHYRKHLFR
ncbi:MAG TPA: oligoribonuclease [Polyangiaceae bacterium]|nr:oligoribonuclease [Polyangiaceae bacterium]